MDRHGGPPAAQRPPLDRGEQQIKDGILRMGALVEEQIRAGIASMTDHNAAAAVAVIRNDARVNAAQREIMNQVASVIATQAPVARDLRFLMALAHVAAELERMGDHASSLAKQGRKLGRSSPPGSGPNLARMGELAAKQLHQVLRAMVDLGPAAARLVAAGDDELDHLYNATFTRTISSMQADPKLVEPGAYSLFAAYYLERIGDRVTNIAEDIVFLATGDVEDLNP